MYSNISQWLESHYERVSTKMEGSSDYVIYKPLPAQYPNARIRLIRWLARLAIAFLLVRLLVFLLILVLGNAIYG